jgi:hypothetical protein
MAYPTIDAPYGLKPVNLIGGQVFAGSTRMFPIQYGYAANIFNGDFVVVTRGFAVRAAIGATTAVNSVTGIFVGCSYTNPVTKQKTFSQYWPTGTLAGDAVAYVVDDPDAVYKAAVCSATTVLASGAKAMVGRNLSMIDNAAVASSLATGNSANAVLSPTATPVTTILPVRCVGVVEDTAYSVTGTGSSSTTTITLTGTGLSGAITHGAGVSYLAANGQVIDTGSFVANAAGYAAGSTSITIDSAIAVPGSVVAIPAASTIIFTVYPELLVKVNLLIHGYYSSATA